MLARRLLPVARRLLPVARLAAGPSARLVSSTAAQATTRTVSKEVVLTTGAILVGLAAAAVVDAAEAPAYDVEAVKKAIAKLIEEDDNRGPLFVRLAWHASGTYSKHDGSGGSNGGLMRFSPEAKWGANAGLDIARGLLEKVKAAFPGITYADLYVLSGVVAVSEMGGPAVPFRAGRVDHADGKASPADGRLPAADQGCPGKTLKHVRDVFYRMGFNDREIVALLGAHSLGRCHADRSGYVNPWTNAPTTFSNEYFRELLENTWTVKKWAGPVQYEDPSGKLMMLPADLALIHDKDFRKVVELYAKDGDAFAKDFAAAFSKLLELGCGFAGPKPWYQVW